MLCGLFTTLCLEILEIVEDLIDDDSDSDEEDNIDEDPERQDKVEETTSEADIEKFLNDFDQEKVETTDLIDKQELLKRIRDLNQQQRRILDDVVERLLRTDYKENPIYLYVSGDAGESKKFIYICNTCFRDRKIFSHESFDRSFKVYSESGY